MWLLESLKLRLRLALYFRGAVLLQFVLGGRKPCAGSHGVRLPVSSAGTSELGETEQIPSLGLGVLIRKIGAWD